VATEPTAVEIGLDHPSSDPRKYDLLCPQLGNDLKCPIPR
jgi:hypothetical protein